MIKRGRLGFGRRSAGAALAVAATIAGLGATASGSSAAVRVEQEIAPLAEVAAPVAPAAMPAPAPAPVMVPGPPGPHKIRIVTITGDPKVPLPVAPPEPPVDPRARHIYVVHMDQEAAREARDQAREQARDAQERARERARDEAQAARDQRQAVRDQAQAARDEAQTMKMSNVRIMVANSLNQARAEMASACAAKGTPVSANERDWNKLALCDRTAFNAQVIRSMEEARAEIVRDRGMDSDGRAKALDALDGAIARMKARGIS